MSNTPEPCYCQQAQDYEEALLQALAYLMVFEEYGISTELINKSNQFRNAAVKTVARYREAQKEYSNG